MSTKTQDFILAAKRRLEAATPGPWKCDLNGHYETRVAETDTMFIHAPQKVDIDQTLDDAELIANAPTDLKLALHMLEIAVAALAHIPLHSSHVMIFKTAEEALTRIAELAEGSK